MNAILMSVSTVCKAIKDPKKRHECLDQLRSDLTELIVGFSHLTLKTTTSDNRYNKGSVDKIRS